MPVERRAAALGAMAGFDLFQRRACRLVGVDRVTIVPAEVLIDLREDGLLRLLETGEPDGPGQSGPPEEGGAARADAGPAARTIELSVPARIARAGTQVRLVLTDGAIRTSNPIRPSSG